MRRLHGDDRGDEKIKRPFVEGLDACLAKVKILLSSSATAKP
jgi:hypothetical protein